MANGRQAKARRLKMADRAAQQMALHFPDTPSVWIWNRRTNDGYSTVPRTLPIAMQAIDSQSKGQPAGHTLFCLWARSPDHPLITIENPATFSGEAGFSGARAVDTWRRRMKKLQELNFISAKPGVSGDFHYVLLLNPNAAVENMREKGFVQDGLYGRFLDRLAEVGAMGEIDALHEYWTEEAKKQPEEVAPPPKKVSANQKAATTKKTPVNKKAASRLA